MGSYLDHKTNSLYWLNKAEELRRSITCLWENGQPSRSVYFMLCGMSLEVLMKAIIVERREEIAYHHNLVQLAADAKVRFSDEERKLLGLLTEAVVWDGRYPNPKDEKTWEKMIAIESEVLFDHKPLGKSGLKILVPNDALDIEAFGRLWDKAHNELVEIAEWNIANFIKRRHPLNGA